MSAEGLAIDPSLLAPQATPNASVARAFVRTNVMLSRLSMEPWVRLLLTRDAPLVLQSDGFFPLFPLVRKFLCDAGITEYDAPTVMSVITGTLRLAGTFEQNACYSEVLFDNFTASPDICCGSPGPALMQERQREALMCVLSDACGRDGPITFLVPDSPTCTAHVSAAVHDADHRCSSPSTGPVASSLRVVQDIYGLIRSFPFGSALMMCSSSAEAVRCIEYALCRDRLCAGRPPDDPVPAFRVGHRFLEMYSDIVGYCGAALAERAMRAIAEVIDATAPRSTHALRTGPAGSEPQQTRGEDRAFRADIDYEYHLHFWKCSDGTIELASVVTHNDFTIPA